MSVRSLRRGSIAASRVTAAPAATVLSLPGTAGNYASTPDTVANSTGVSGDFDIRAKLTLADWTPASNMAIAAKWNSGSTRSWRLMISSSGIQFSYTRFGSTIISTTTRQTGLTDGTTGWVRIARVRSTGVTTYYASTDGSSWSSLGSSTADAGGGFYDTSGNLTIGTQEEFTTTMFNGKIHYFEMRDGIDGTVVAKFDAEAVTPAGTRNPSSVVSSTGETWTINGSAWDWATA